MDELRPELAEKAIATGLAAYPEFAEFGPRLELVKLFRGQALQVKFAREDRPGGERAWAFQNAVIGEYKRLTGEAVPLH